MTLGETDKGATDSLHGNGQASSTEAGSTSQATTFTEGQVEKRLSDALAEQGRKHKAELDAEVAKERESNLTVFKETQERIVTLEKELKELSEGEGDAATIAKLVVSKRAEIAELKAERGSLKKEREAHEAEWQQKQERVTRAEDTNFEIELWDLSEQYEGGDGNRLKQACGAAKITSVEGAKALADVLWTKKSSGLATLINGRPDPGGTSGGQNTYATIRDAYIQNPNDPKIRTAYLEARRKRGY